ncbi:hypothetical protein K1719_007660 [Acacia pycnantha]|nr:hypothetical protein K1719_007660 [Acacia pycnantha]
MSSLKNVIPRRRAQPSSRKRFGLLEKHKDYAIRAKAFHKKEEAIRTLQEKAALRNPDEFYFKMIRSKVVGGVHRPDETNKYTHEELMLMKTQDIGYVLQKVQSQKKKIEKLTASLQFVDHQQSGHIYFAEDRQYAKEIKSLIKGRRNLESNDATDEIKRRTASSYRGLEERKNRLSQLKRIYNNMVMQKELQQKGRKRKLREDEIVCSIAQINIFVQH